MILYTYIIYIYICVCVSLLLIFCLAWILQRQVADFGRFGFPEHLPVSRRRCCRSEEDGNRRPGFLCQDEDAQMSQRCAWKILMFARCRKIMLRQLYFFEQLYLDISSTMFDTFFSLDLRSNLTWALMIPCAHFNCGWASLRVTVSCLSNLQLSLNLAVWCYLHWTKFQEITGWSVKHVDHWDLPFLSLELQVKHGLYDELPHKTRHIIESCREAQVVRERQCRPSKSIELIEWLTRVCLTGCSMLQELLDRL